MKKLLSVLLLFIMLCCSSCRGKLLSNDVRTVGETLKNAGYVATIFQNDSMTDDLEREMKKAFESKFQKGMEGHLKGYLFATKPLDNKTVIEVFIFEKEEDAKSLYNLKKEDPVFVKGEAEIRLLKNAVTMGYMEILDLVES